MIILKGNNDDILSINLNDILYKIENIEEYFWKLIWIEGVSYQIDILDFENKVNKSSDGLLIDSEKLLEISNSFYQLLELVLIGDENKDNLCKLEDDEKMKENCDFFIELIDGAYWEITSKKSNFIKSIQLL